MPSGDPPEGTGATVRANGLCLFATSLAAVPVGRSPTGAGGSPALPIFKTRSQNLRAAESGQYLNRVMHFISRTAPEQAISSDKQFVSLSPRGTSGERAGERGPAAASAGHVLSVGSARASRAVFGALAEHTVRSAGRRPVQPRRLGSPPLNRYKFRAPICPCEWPPKNLR